MGEVFRDYDEDCDVMYVTVGNPNGDALSFEDEHGLIWRESEHGKCLGVTIPDFKYFWGARATELSQLLDARLPALIFA